MRISKRKTLITIAVLAIGIGGVTFALTKAWQRSDIDDAWAQKAIDAAELLQIALAEYHEANGEFPAVLKELNSDIKGPPAFYDHSSTEKWHYRRLNSSDYQVYATASSFVSSFDALVIRYSGNYPSDWFDSLDCSHSKTFGEWQYITGFSELPNAP